MIVFGTCVGGDGSKYRERSLPGIEKATADDDLVLAESGVDGICGVYNGFLDQLDERCEALVLMHDDVEITDDDFRAKVLAAVAEPDVGVVGVIGGAGLEDLGWWDARRLAGRVAEPRGTLEHSPVAADVDACDGLMLVLSPRAIRELRFDRETFPAYHGYDVDICLQAREAGLRVVTRDIELTHWTKGGFGDPEAYQTADQALRAKWPQWLQPRTAPERAVRRAGRIGRRARSVVSGKAVGF